MTRGEELLGAPLMVARRHGQGVAFHAASRIERLLRTEEPGAVGLREGIAARIPLVLERVAASPS